MSILLLMKEDTNMLEKERKGIKRNHFLLEKTFSIPQKHKKYFVLIKKLTNF